MTDLASLAARLSPKARELLVRELTRTGTPGPIDPAGAQPIAVIGMGCRLPGDIVGPESYWDFLVRGGDGISEVPADRWDADEFYDPDPSAPGRMTTKWGGFISDVAGFDAEFFGISPREAQATDPQQRMLLEVAWEALEHAGIPPDSLTGSRTAVMAGLSTWDYMLVGVERRAEIDAYLSTGIPHSSAVGRISYLLGLRGPAVAVDTACSSSLVAVHLACQSLRLRESDLALAGGVQLNLSPYIGIALSKYSALSRVGRCKSFDAAADGFVQSEGCGVVVLKRLADALRDGDRVLSVIQGSAVNQDGRSNGMTAPNAGAQREVIAEALRAADVSADTVHYVEAHGTGTPLGDPVEFEALAATYGRGDGACVLGAVKSNLGHLEASGGVAGLIKATLALRHGQIPANLHFNGWNPAIDAASTRFFVPTAMTPWPRATGPRRAAVSSFGFSGTNAHVVLEQAPPAPESAASSAPGRHVTALVVSGKTRQRLASTAAVLADWMHSDGADVPLADVAHTLNHHRTRHRVVAAVCARDRAEAIEGLAALAADQPAATVTGPRDRRCGPGTVFVYSGQGSQWIGMGRQLIAEEPVFAAAIAELEPEFIAHTGFSLQEALASDSGVQGVDRIQPVLVAIQLALTQLWRSYGVEPDAVIGHSMGEVSAAVVAGALSVSDGLRVIATRSRLAAQLGGHGAMALLELDPQATEELIAEVTDVTIAVFASPRQTVVAGPPDVVQSLIGVVEQRNLLARLVGIDIASHHRVMDPVLPELRSALADLTPSVPTIPFITTAYEASDGTPVLGAEYWAANLRNPVRFSQAVIAAGRSYGTFVEISPHPLLTHAIGDTLGTDDHEVLSTVNRHHPEGLYFHLQLAAIEARPNGAVTPSVVRGQLAEIPRTPWQHVTHWLANRSSSWESGTGHPLLGTHVEVPPDGQHVWQGDVGTEAVPWLTDHDVHGLHVLPAAAIVEMVLAAACEALEVAAESLRISRLELPQLLARAGHSAVTTRLVHGADDAVSVQIFSRADRQGAWTRHAVAELERVSRPSVPDWEAAPDTEISAPDDAPRHPGFRLHPAILDSAMQLLQSAIADRSSAAAWETVYLPTAVDTVRVFGDTGRHARCRVELVEAGGHGDEWLGRIRLTDDTGRPAAEVAGIRLQAIARGTLPLPLEHKIFDTSWLAKPISGRAAAAHDAPGSWLVLADAHNADLAETFGRRLESRAQRVTIAELVDESRVLHGFTESAADTTHPPAGVVIFMGQGPADDLDTALARAQQYVWAIAVVVRAVVGGWHGRAPRVWLVSGRGLVVDGAEPGDPAIGALRGLIRVLAYEHPELHATLLDLDPAADPLGSLEREIASADTDDVVARRGERRYVERFCRATMGTPALDPVVRAGGSYVVTGGLGGLGGSITRWLVDGGATRVVLNARSEPSDERWNTLAELESRAEIVFVRGDIAAPGVADRLVEAAEERGMSLRGVVHAAAVIDDALLAGMSKASLDRVWAGKAAGAVRLHDATRVRQLDWWLVFSSVASLLGSPGQSAYASANSWLDALVSWRRASGLPATVIDWGQWADVGVARSLTSSVLDPMAPSEAIEALTAVLASGRARTGIARLRPDRALAAFPEIRGLGYFANVVDELKAQNAGDEWAGPEGLRHLEPAEARQVIVERVGEPIAAIMGFPDRSAIDPSLPLIDLGMDSVMAVRIRNATASDFGVEPAVALLLRGASLTDLAVDVADQLGLGDVRASAPADGVRERAQQRAAARRDAGMQRRGGRPA